jgi:hypothetical protein
MRTERRVKRRIFSGAILEQEVFSVAANKKNLKTAEPRIRFANERERERHREGIRRRHHIRLVNTNFTPASLYSTLTMDNRHEVHTFEEADRVADRFIRRLKKENPNTQLILYMGRGENTNRIHFHMLSNGVSAETIQKQWRAGTVARIENLRENIKYDGIDCGQDYTGLANYLFDHWTPEQGGHHYRATRNLEKPEYERPTIALRRYSESRPPMAPQGYRLIGYKFNEFGYQSFKYTKDIEKRRRE